LLKLSTPGLPAITGDPWTSLFKRELHVGSRGRPEIIPFLLAGDPLVFEFATQRFLDAFSRDNKSQHVSF
jgi:hypothetical protein